MVGKGPAWSESVELGEAAWGLAKAMALRAEWPSVRANRVE